MTNITFTDLELERLFYITLGASLSAKEYKCSGFKDTFRACQQIYKELPLSVREEVHSDMCELLGCDMTLNQVKH